MAELFQSTPAITDGRRCGDGDEDEQEQCFNPRPPSLTGDAQALALAGVVAHVSIHARHH